ncbi:GNAT family N-acetyltransferase [Mesobacillus subterraneus]|uniref:RimJ/RimL family protein N-acetyltransferase n=1 Tax=Mesobacillus stamsii TaxID=225347 RepID=A0ABU0FZQ5_9BACI|nr:RimJ/RimL family protein N-acetyltransferase [Mesobacillus stamsii]
MEKNTGEKDIRRRHDRFCASVKGYHKVYARYFQSNPASGKVMQKLGMKQEGILLKQVEKEVEDIISNGIIK